MDENCLGPPAAAANDPDVLIHVYEVADRSGLVPAQRRLWRASPQDPLLMSQRGQEKHDRLIARQCSLHDTALLEARRARSTVARASWRWKASPTLIW